MRLDDDLYTAMQRVWEQEGIQPSEQMRRALRAYLERKGALKKKTGQARKFPPRA